MPSESKDVETFLVVLLVPRPIYLSLDVFQAKKLYMDMNQPCLEVQKLELGKKLIEDMGFRAALQHTHHSLHRFSSNILDHVTPQHSHCAAYALRLMGAPNNITSWVVAGRNARTAIFVFNTDRGIVTRQEISLYKSYLTRQEVGPMIRYCTFLATLTHGYTLLIV